MRYDLYDGGKVLVDGKEVTAELPPLSEIIDIVRNSSGYLFGVAAQCDGSILRFLIDTSTKELWIEWGNYFLNTFSVPTEWREKLNVLWSACYKSAGPLYLGRVSIDQQNEILALNQFAVHLKEAKD